jgi:hypothetical protein
VVAVSKAEVALTAALTFTPRNSSTTLPAASAVCGVAKMKTDVKKGEEGFDHILDKLKTTRLINQIPSTNETQPNLIGSDDNRLKIHHRTPQRTLLVRHEIY